MGPEMTSAIPWCQVDQPTFGAKVLCAKMGIQAARVEKGYTSRYVLLNIMKLEN